MTIEEASEKYCIPIKILKEYESMELCKTEHSSVIFNSSIIGIHFFYNTKCRPRVRPTHIKSKMG